MPNFEPINQTLLLILVIANIFAVSVIIDAVSGFLDRMAYAIAIYYYLLDNCSDSFPTPKETH